MPMRVQALAENEIPIDPVPPRQGGVIDLELQKQDEQNWCWAACIEMVLKHYRVSADEQCQIVQKALSTPEREIGCCTNVNTSNDDPICDQTLEDKRITKLWKDGYNVEVDFQTRTPLLNRAVIRDEFKLLLDNNQLVELGYSRREIGGREIGHVVILYGWQLDNAGRLIFLFHDPSPVANVAVDALDIIRTESGRLDATWKIPQLEDAEA